VRTLIAARYLMCAAYLGKHSYVDVLDIGAGDANRHDILRLAGGRAGMTADAASVVNHLGPLDGARASCLWLDHYGPRADDENYAAEYIMECLSGGEIESAPPVSGQVGLTG